MSEDGARYSCCGGHDPLLIDIGPLSGLASDLALDVLHKALADPPDDPNLWAPHPSPYVATMVEAFTLRGTDRFDGMLRELLQWLDGRQHRPGKNLSKAISAWPRWTPAEMLDILAYLESKPPESFTLDDWMTLVEWLFHRYLPPDVLMSDAEWLTAKASIMGRVQARMPNLAIDQADRIVAATPETVRDAASLAPMSQAQAAAMEYGQAHAAENIVSLTDAARHRIRRTVMDHYRQEAVGNRQPDLKSALLDDFGAMNRDWRRIAVTEAGEMANQGVIAAQQTGGRVRRVEKYRGACPFCRKIDGEIFTVVDPAKPDKDGQTEIWTGKTNIGRAASPRKRVGGVLVEREPHELWWPAAGVQHPNCRGAWVPLAVPASSGDAAFDEWLAAAVSVGRG